MGMNELACVLVLYKKTPEQSQALQSLREFFQLHERAGDLPSLLIYDNSAEPAEVRPATWRGVAVTYRHDARNPGLAEAYNHALESAAASGRRWLLLLDQDTHVTASFLDLLLQRTTDAHHEVCALVPKLRQGQDILSPTRVKALGEVAVEAEFEGVFEGRIAALNSGACFRVRALQEICGFPLEYPLDYLDHAVFFRLQQAGGKVQVIAAVLEHHLSLLNLNQEMSLDRYRNMLAAESRFVRESAGARGAWILRLRLLKRGWKQATEQRSVRHALATWKVAFRGGGPR